MCDNKLQEDYSRDYFHHKYSLRPHQMCQDMIYVCAQALTNTSWCIRTVSYVIWAAAIHYNPLEKLLGQIDNKTEN